MQNFHALIFQLGPVWCCKPLMDIFRYVKKNKQSPLFLIDSARLISHVSIMLKIKSWKNRKDGVQLMARDLHPVWITRNKQNM